MKWATGGFKVTSDWGKRNDPFTKEVRTHQGLDLALPKGTAVGSNISGEVIYAGMGKSGTGYGGYGNVVAIKDSNGNVHVFGHLDSVNVKKGQKISTGTLLGKSGNTGKSTGAHLHYEVRKNGELNNNLNPRKYLQLG
ncbi:peptidase M23-like protein [Bacillus oleivorans]|uniref:Peptidase M23-like protein n=1 Tax=Bacillus oleivorans TaxID=1448271 RepID=A0A285CKD0_9BACI|nr:M23 family metallopeptidase [Bacillus oleivorans]SNX67815.1 peptidase M23-like protein [Bacillus oleivorans]